MGELPSPNPLGDAAAETDQVGLAMNAIAAGWALASALLGIVTFVAARLAASSGASALSDVQPDDPQVNVMIYGVMISLFAAGALAWTLMRPIASSYRRFGLSMVSLLGGFLIAAIATFLVRQLLGEPALGGLVIAGLAVTAMFIRRARASV